MERELGANLQESEKPPVVLTRLSHSLFRKTIAIGAKLQVQTSTLRQGKGQALGAGGGGPARQRRRCRRDSTRLSRLRCAWPENCLVVSPQAPEIPVKSSSTGAGASENAEINTDLVNVTDPSQSPQSAPDMNSEGAVGGAAAAVCCEATTTETSQQQQQPQQPEATTGSESPAPSTSNAEQQES